MVYCCVYESSMFYVCSIEDGVGFEDHVLLNHMLKGFPSRG